MSRAWAIAFSVRIYFLGLAGASECLEARLRGGGYQAQFLRRILCFENYMDVIHI